MGGGEATGSREGMSCGDATGGGDATCGDGRRDGRRRGAAHVQARDACEGSCLWHVTASASSTSQRTSRTKAPEVVVDAGSEDPGSPEDLHLNRPRTKPGGALRKDHLHVPRSAHTRSAAQAKGERERKNCAAQHRPRAGVVDHDDQHQNRPVKGVADLRVGREKKMKPSAAAEQGVRQPKQKAAARV